MSERDKAVDRVLRLRGHSMNFRNTPTRPMATVDGVTMTREQFDREVWSPVEAEYVAIIQGIDWTRILLEALGRHFYLKHDGDDACGDCVQDVLLRTETMPWWGRDADPRTLAQIQDDEEAALERDTDNP